MGLETTTAIKGSGSQRLAGLIRATLDSCEGLREVAYEIDDMELALHFRNLAEERAAMMLELQQFVDSAEFQMAREQRRSTKVREGWMCVRSRLGGGNPAEILVEAERSEKKLVEEFARTIKEEQKTSTVEILNDHYKVVRAAHHGLVDLRDEYASLD